MKTQTRTVGDTKYTFICLEGHNGYDVMEVCVQGTAYSTYPKFRYEKYKSHPWQLLGKSTAESSKLLEILGEIWDACL